MKCPECLHENPSDVSEYRRIAYKSCDAMLKNMKKSAGDRSRTPKLVGRFHWLINEQNMAVKLWKRAVTESKRLGAQSDLARTYMEIGTRFQDTFKYLYPSMTTRGLV